MSRAWGEEVVRRGLALRDGVFELARKLQGRCPQFGGPVEDWTPAEVFAGATGFDRDEVVEVLQAVWDLVLYPDGEGRFRECAARALAAEFPLHSGDGRKLFLTAKQAQVARLAYFLSEYHERSPFPFPQVLVAEAVGVTRRRVGDVLKNLEDMGVLEVVTRHHTPPRGGRAGVARTYRFVGRVPRYVRPPGRAGDVPY